MLFGPSLIGPSSSGFLTVRTEKAKPYPAAPIDELPDGVEVRGEASTATVRGAAVPLGELAVAGLAAPGAIWRVKYVFPLSIPSLA